MLQVLKRFRRPRIAIYSAIFGGYDDPKPALRQSVPTDFFLFSESGFLDPKGWLIDTSVAVDRSAHPRMQAKWFRMHPHVLFPNGRRNGRRYDYTIWIDGSLAIQSPDFARDMASLPGKHGLAIFGHPWRDCIYEEAIASVAMPKKYSGLPIMDQVESYRAQGYPAHNGLMATGILVRDTADRGLPAIDEAWWAENERWTYQDQLSLPFVLWRAGRWFTTIPGDIFHSPLVSYVHHHRND